MNADTLKNIILILGVVVGAIAAAPIPALDQYDLVLGPIATALLGWAGLPRPGDAKAPK